jgi:hypothetical protein
MGHRMRELGLWQQDRGRLIVDWLVPPHMRVSIAARREITEPLDAHLDHIIVCLPQGIGVGIAKTLEIACCTASCIGNEVVGCLAGWI